MSFSRRHCWCSKPYERIPEQYQPHQSTHNAADKPFRFMDLPSEMRNAVYEELLLLRPGMLSCWPEVLAVSKRIIKEATGIQYDDNVFDLKFQRHGIHVLQSHCAGTDIRNYGAGSEDRPHYMLDKSPLKFPLFLQRVSSIKIGTQDLMLSHEIRPAAMENFLYALCVFLAPENCVKSLEVDLRSVRNVDIYPDNPTLSIDTSPVRLLRGLEKLTINGANVELEKFYQADPENNKPNLKARCNKLLNWTKESLYTLPVGFMAENPISPDERRFRFQVGAVAQYLVDPEIARNIRSIPDEINEEKAPILAEMLRALTKQSPAMSSSAIWPLIEDVFHADIDEKLEALVSGPLMPSELAIIWATCQRRALTHNVPLMILFYDNRPEEHENDGGEGTDSRGDNEPEDDNEQARSQPDLVPIFGIRVALPFLDIWTGEREGTTSL